jgi:hypothetical protein
MNVAGIDFSSNAIDVVRIHLDDLEPPSWHRYELVGQDAFDRTRNIRAAMPWGSFWQDTLAIGIEHPAGKFGTGSMMRVQGAVLACLPPGVLVQPWPPSSWRKAVGLPGNCSKEDVWRHAGPAFPDDPCIPQDALDAYCIALATRLALDTQAAA